MNHKLSSLLLFEKSSIHQQDTINEEDEKTTAREIIFVPPGTEAESLSPDLWDEIDEAQPSRWWILKEVC
jgi:hypothetical protein